MKQKRMLPPVVQTEDSKLLDMAYLTPERADCQIVFKVPPALPIGAENAISAPMLAKRLGCNRRQLRQLIEWERDAGAVILSDSHGYYRPADGETGREELIVFVGSMTSRAISILNSTRSARQALGVLPGQVEFDDMGEGV